MKKIAVLSPPEIPLPVKSYAGIELIAQDFATSLAEKGYEVYVYCNHDKGSLDKVTLCNYPEGFDFIRENYDYTFDFTHQKAFAQNYTAYNYAATVFLTDRLSLVNDIFPTKAVRDEFQPYVKDAPVIYPGIKNVYEYRKDKSGYLLFLGRIAPFKRCEIALQVARLSGTPVIIAGHVGRFSEWPNPNYATEIKAMCEKQEGAHFIANPTLEEKKELLAGAIATIVPSDWSIINSKESFGIVAVESLMSGTPVITSGDGGLKEIVTEQCGAVCISLVEYLDAVEQAKTGAWKPEECRKRGEYFSSDRMADDYIKFAYEMRRRW